MFNGKAWPNLKHRHNPPSLYQNEWQSILSVLTLFFGIENWHRNSKGSILVVELYQKFCRIYFLSIQFVTKCFVSSSSF